MRRKRRKERRWRGRRVEEEEMIVNDELEAYP